VTAIHRALQNCAVLLFSVASLAGCGTESDRLSVYGSVKQGGIPVENGQVLFKPTPGANGPIAGANIKNGRYQFDSETGPIPGEYRIQITAGGPPKKFYAGTSDEASSKSESSVHEFSRELNENSRELDFDLPP
jgi:hypothetical protein